MVSDRISEPLPVQLDWVCAVSQSASHRDAEVAAAASGRVRRDQTLVSLTAKLALVRTTQQMQKPIDRIAQGDDRSVARLISGLEDSGAS